MEVEEALDVGVGVACLPQVSQGGADVVGGIAVCAPARKNVHEGIAGGGVPLGSYARCPVLEDGRGSGEASLCGELLGVVDKFQLPAPVSEVAAPVEGGRAERESGAGRLLGLLGLLEGSGELLQGPDQLPELWRGRRLLHGGDVLDDCLDLGGSGFRGCMEQLDQVAYCGGGGLSQDVHVLPERGKGLEEGGGFHLCKRVAIHDLENGFRGGWTGDKSQKKENLRYPT